MKQNIFVNWIEEGQLTIPQSLLMYYTDLGLTETELVVLLQINSFHQKAANFPSMCEIAARMTIEENEVMRLIEALIHKSFLAIEKNEGSIISEQYSLRPLWERLFAFYENKRLEQETKEVVDMEKNLYSLFEAEFGRPLSPLELEMLSQWLDQDGIPPFLIKEALKEAVLNTKLNFRYIDRILLNWTKKGVKTIEQARIAAEEFHQQRSNQNHLTSDPVQIQKSENRISFQDWLEKRKG